MCAAEDEGVSAPFEQRSLPPPWANLPYHVYRVRRELQVISGLAVPWFDQPGGGTAYVLPHPVAQLVADGSLAAHWLVKSGSGTYAYDVNISRSKDGGRTWDRPFIPHTDGTQTEHGFVSLLPLRDGRLGAVWVEGQIAQITRRPGAEAGRSALTGSVSTRVIVAGAAISPTIETRAIRAGKIDRTA